MDPPSAVSPALAFRGVAPGVAAAAAAVLIVVLVAVVAAVVAVVVAAVVVVVVLSVAALVEPGVPFAAASGFDPDLSVAKKEEH
jgi:ABC-type transport system involved in cytochrome bd biosynthesis fused ATPase/permease subunit